MKSQLQQEMLKFQDEHLLLEEMRNSNHELRNALQQFEKKENNLKDEIEILHKESANKIEQIKKDFLVEIEKLQEEKIPKLWVLTPTASQTILSGFNVNQKEGFPPGIYFLGDNLRSAIVAIHQLPKTIETLWLRLLGRGRVQEQAIEELQQLSPSNPFQQATLKLVYNLRENLRANQNLEEEDRELIVRLQPLYEQDQERARQEGRKEGEQRVIIRFLNRRLGEIDSSLIERINGLSIEQLEALGEALLDFSGQNDLTSWLENNIHSYFI